MTNLSAMSEQQLPQHSSLQSHSYDKLGSSPAFTATAATSAVALSYSLPTLASAVHHEGQLYKRSSILKQWHPSYYVLDDLTLVTYPQQGVYQQVASQPPSPSSHQYKRVELSEYNVKSLSPSAHNRPYCFTLVSRDTAKEHLFAAPSEQARTAWIDAISKAMKTANVARRERANSKEKEKAASDMAQQENGEKSELVSGAHNHGKREEMMSGKGMYSNALITSSSSSSLASITHNMSASTSSNSLSSPPTFATPATRPSHSHCAPCPARAVLAPSATAVQYTL